MNENQTSSKVTVNILENFPINLFFSHEKKVKAWHQELIFFPYEFIFWLDFKMLFQIELDLIN